VREEILAYAQKEGLEVDTLVRGVTKQVEETMMVRDPREMGNRMTAKEQGELMRLMQSEGSTLPSQMDRVNLRAQVSSGLGIGPKPSGRTIQQASAVDRLLEIGAARTKAEALTLLESMPTF